MRRADPHQSVADSLQADVMRFMAIIAFCLVAILALVRSVAPAEPSTDPGASPAAMAEVAAPPATPAPAEVPAAPARPQPPVQPRAQPRTAVAAAEPEPAAAEEAAAAAAAEAVETPPEVEAAPAVDPPPGALARVPEPAPPAPPAADEGLSLRFASERDFLRLVSRGRIQVYAFNGREVLTIGADLTATPASAPGEVHELLPETIPHLMSGALAGHGSGFRWAVAMPEAMARQIRRFVDQGATGELIIDRFGEVRHREV